MPRQRLTGKAPAPLPLEYPAPLIYPLHRMPQSNCFGEPIRVSLNSWRYQLKVNPSQPALYGDWLTIEGEYQNRQVKKTSAEKSAFL